MDFPGQPFPGIPGLLTVGAIIPGHQLVAPLSFIDELAQTGNTLLHGVAKH